MSRRWPEHTTVLVVEDDLTTARIIQARLEMEGLKVFVALNGVEALEILNREAIDLITTDLMMPSMNGFRLVQEVRDLPAPKGRTPILLISSNQNEQDMVRCLAAGADDYMTKPISVQVLMERLWRLFERSRRAG
ncbi:response regulator [Geothrix sp.]|jgi:DNA-binding response OmpR family regulator|uniref:response regulator transcription factor n=1 Tax=Geothrix sp. TaxID=1962974 RepID=UPI0025C483D7|nr:response regulator [Geothrix sp.]